MANKTKVSIIGCGRVGITAAYTMYLKDHVYEIVLFDRDKKRIEAERLDFLHGLPFMGKSKIKVATELRDIAGSDVIIYTVGASQKPGETRLQLVKKNTEILETVFPKLLKYSRESVFLIVANPVDVLTYKAYKLAKLPRGRIFSTGTTLDTARYRYYLSEKLKVNPRSIHGYVLGEHGDSSFATITETNVGGQPILTIGDINKSDAADAYRKSRDAAYEVIAGKGATYYSIGVVISEIVEAIIDDSRRIYPVSVPLKGEYGIEGVSLSVPCVIGRGGVKRIMEIKLSPEEKILLKLSASTIRQYL